MPVFGASLSCLLQVRYRSRRFCAVPQLDGFVGHSESTAKPCAALTCVNTSLSVEGFKEHRLNCRLKTKILPVYGTSTNSKPRGSGLKCAS